MSGCAWEQPAIARLSASLVKITNARWHAGTLARWHAGTLARWHAGMLACGSVSVSVSVATDFVAKVAIDGLRPARDYRYEILLNDKPVGEGAFKTFPSKGKQATFSIAFGGAASSSIPPLTTRRSVTRSLRWTAKRRTLSSCGAARWAGSEVLGYLFAMMPIALSAVAFS